MRQTVSGPEPSGKLPACPCGEGEDDGEGYCLHCGRRLDATAPLPATAQRVLAATKMSPAPSPVPPASGDPRMGHEVRALGRTLAAITDPGLRRGHNEDAFALWLPPASDDERGGTGAEPVLSDGGGAHSQAVPPAPGMGHSGAGAVPPPEGVDNLPRSDYLAVLVVCDGVSSSSDGALAARVAADTTRDALVERLTRGSLSETDMHEAIAAAHAAVCAQADWRDDPEPPGTTLVAAAITGTRAVIGWVGDSRTYLFINGARELDASDDELIGDNRRADTEMAQAPTAAAEARGEREGATGGPTLRTAMLHPPAEAANAGGTGEAGNLRLLTRDHSLLSELLADGMSEAEALEQPHAHAITRCVGPLEEVNGGGPPTAEVLTVDLPLNARLLLCSDGLWNELPFSSLVAIMTASATAPPLAAADALVAAALAAGGSDNVTVAVAN